MKSLFVCFIFLGFWHDAAVLGDAFEYECDILQKLDYLESKAKTSDIRIAELESKDKEKEQLLNNLKNMNDALTSKVAELENSNDALTKQLQETTTTAMTTPSSVSSSPSLTSAPSLTSTPTPVSTTTENSACPEGWERNGSSCYYIEKSYIYYFDDAQEFCKNRSANLVHVNDATENDFLKSLMEQSGRLYFWIGIKYNVSDTTWRWIDDGTVAGFTDWYPGEPNGRGAAECCYPWNVVSYRWVDEYCSGLNASPLCEKGIN